MAPITTPAMAPEDNPEDDLEALGELDELESGKEGEEVVASSFRQQMFLSWAIGGGISYSEVKQWMK